MSLPELQVFNAGSLKALRAARVLRPLKLVSGIPSKSSKYVNIFTVRPVLPFHVQSQWWNQEMRTFYNPGQKCWDSCTVQNAYEHRRNCIRALLTLHVPTPSPRIFQHCIEWGRGRGQGFVKWQHCFLRHYLWHT